jgi:hypothetical protein
MIECFIFFPTLPLFPYFSLLLLIFFILMEENNLLQLDYDSDNNINCDIEEVLISTELTLRDGQNISDKPIEMTINKPVEAGIWKMVYQL